MLRLPLLQMFQDLDLPLGSHYGQVSTPVAVPDRAKTVTASVSCRIKLVALGVNGEPQYQDFSMQKRYGKGVVWLQSITNI